MTLPYLTASLPGTGGRLRATDDDFVVEEVPAYLPIGVGDHTFLRVEKRGIATHEAIARMAKALGVRPREIGYAGLKDAHAVAEQTFSIEHYPIDKARAALVGVIGVRVIDAKLHRNKLKVGHLRGNRFRIRVRDVVPGAADRALAILGVLSAQGTPNWFGEQRFGSREDNDAVGRMLVRGQLVEACDAIVGPTAVADRDPRVAEARARYAAGDLDGAASAFPPSHRSELAVLDALRRGRTKDAAVLTIPRPTLRLLVSAYQSAIFNRLLEQRLADLGRLEPGDLAFLHDKGAVFLVEDAAAEQPRADRLEISPSGPLPGTRSILADGQPGERERAVLTEESLTPEMFNVRGVGEFEGERRPFRIPIGDPEVRDDPDAPADAPSLLVAFDLPRGAYATAVMREIMK
ncbi:MAG: tRNA pseudouridine(13) synthase TruD [Planctomycetes bacterium]|nr:tRNA pseudouridine(13) synthase TruD [Planctomycetota bacterium]